MKNTYYTPSIEEFHVGFEYETNYLKDDWEKQILTIEEASYFFASYLGDASELEFRVKHLDREDILECGFVKDVALGFQKDKLIIQETTQESSSDYAKIVYDIAKMRCEITDCEDWSLFVGTIKNKSELKRLLVQLGIVN